MKIRQNRVALGVRVYAIVIHFFVFIQHVAMPYCFLFLSMMPCRKQMEKLPILTKIGRYVIELKHILSGYAQRQTKKPFVY